MDGYELRSEIHSSGTKYYIQSNVVPAQRAVITSLFVEGNLLSKQSQRYEESLSQDGLRAMVRRLHDDRKARITSLLDVRGALVQDADARAHLKLGEALYKEKMFREAMAEVVRAIKLGLEDSRGYAILGNCLLSISDHEKALRAFQKGLEISPEYPDLHNSLGQTYLAMQRCREAVSSFEKALELNAYYQAAHLNLAIALAYNVVLKQDYELSRGLPGRLRESLDRNLQLRPSLDTDAFRQAMRAVEQEQYETVYDRLCEIRNEQDKFAQTDLSLELYLIMRFRSEQLTEEDIDRYIDRIGLALEANPGYADLQNDLGILYTAKCKILIDTATERFQEALKLNPNFKKAEKNLKLVTNDRQGIHFLLKALLD